MKGQFVSIIGTIMVFIFGIVTMIFAVLLSFQYSIMSGVDAQIQRNFEAKMAFSRPYYLAELLSNIKMDDRTFFEAATEMMATGSIEGASAKEVSHYLKNFMDYYGFKFYNIEIEKDGETIFQASSVGQNCGNNLAGICTFEIHENAPCGIGRVDIPNNECQSNQRCCIDDEAGYRRKAANGIYEQYDIVECGEDNKGICNMETGFWFFSRGCADGYKEIDDDDKCEGVNNDKTPLCCAQIGQEAVTLVNNIDVPLLFGKSAITTDTYHCIDTNKMSCPGELARGFCPDQAPNIQCCITQTIPCRTASGEAGVCLDIQNCDRIGGTSSVSDACGTDNSNFQCCVGDTTKVNTFPVGLEPTDNGACDFGTDIGRGTIHIRIDNGGEA